MATKAYRNRSKAWKALHLRVLDIMGGACQGDDPEDDCYFVTASAIPSIVRGVIVRLLPKDYEETKAYLTAAYSMDAYDTATSLTDFLYANGIRANGVKR